MLRRARLRLPPSIRFARQRHRLAVSDTLERRRERERLVCGGRKVNCVLSFLRIEIEPGKCYFGRIWSVIRATARRIQYSRRLTQYLERRTLKYPFMDRSNGLLRDWGTRTRGLSKCRVLPQIVIVVVIVVIARSFVAFLLLDAVAYFHCFSEPCLYRREKINVFFCWKSRRNIICVTEQRSDESR